jgi:hypothetical protein
MREDIVAVVELIRRRGSEKHVPKLFVEGVPPGLDRSSFRRLLAQAGYSFQDSGVPWANHYVVRLSNPDPSVQAAWEEGRVPRVAYTELEGQGVIFLRVPGILKARLTGMADQQQVSLNEFCARTLAEAAR